MSHWYWCYSITVKIPSRIFGSKKNTHGHELLYVDGIGQIDKLSCENEIRVISLPRVRWTEKKKGERDNCGI